MSKHRSKSNQHLNVGTIMSRLPLHRQLSDSQAMLIKLTPVWLDWSKDQNLTSTNYSLTNFNNGVLTIHCDNAIGASQLKHQQQTLLDYFHTKEFSDVEQINIRVSQPSLSSSSSSSNSVEAINSKATFTTPSADSLKSIQACRNGIKSDRLSNSLSKLEKTLESLKPSNPKTK